MGGLLRGGRRGFGSGGRAFNGAAILTRHLVAFSTRQWRRCRLGSGPPSAGRRAYCLADGTDLPGKGRELRRELAAAAGTRANAFLWGLRARAPAGRETWPLRGGPAPARSAGPAQPIASGGYLSVRALWTVRGCPRRAEGWPRRRLRAPLAELLPAIFGAFPRPGRETRPRPLHRGPSPGRGTGASPQPRPAPATPIPRPGRALRKREGVAARNSAPASFGFDEGLRV